MYCSSCAKKFSAKHARCPECSAWLSPNAPAAVMARSAGGTSERPAPPPPANDWSGGWDAPSSTSAPAPAWDAGQPSTPPLASSGWDPAPSNSEPVHDWTETEAQGTPSPAAGSGWEKPKDEPVANHGHSWWTPEEADESDNGPSMLAPPPPAEEPSLLSSAPAPQQGWWGDEAPAPALAPAAPRAQETSWDPPAETPAAPSSSGWLSGEPEEEERPVVRDIYATDDDDHDDQDQEKWVDDEWNPEQDGDIDRAISEATGGSGMGRTILLALILVVGIVGGLALSQKNDDTPQAQQNESVQFLADAAIWLENADKSIEAKDHTLAAAQLRSAMDLLKKGEAPKEEIAQAQLKLARSLFHSEAFEDSRTLWLQLKKDPAVAAEAKTMIAKNERGLRLLANNTIGVARQALKGGNSKEAQRKAQEALDLYTRYGGQRDQLAKAHGILGDAALKQRNKRLAIHHYSEARALHPEGRYRSELSRLGALNVRPSKPKPSRPAQPVQAVNPSSNPGTFVPKGKRNIGGVYRPPSKKPAQQYNAPPSAKPKKPQKKYVYIPKAKKRKKKRKNDSFQNY